MIHDVKPDKDFLATRCNQIRVWVGVPVPNKPGRRPGGASARVHAMQGDQTDKDLGQMRDPIECCTAVGVHGDRWRYYFRVFLLTKFENFLACGA